MFSYGRIMAGSLAVGLFACSAVQAFAEPTGNDLKGKYAYRGVYKACRERGEVESDKPSIHPDAKTQAQWEQVFAEKNFKIFGCAKEWDALTDEGRNDILTYLWKHAADSPTPAKCK